jgi:hypothetical protein
MGRPKDPRPVEERFLEKVIKQECGCWVWKGNTCRTTGYGYFWLDGRSRPAHRVSYELFVGPIPEGLQIDHVRARGCRSRACVNPAHLEPVTIKENLLRGDTFNARNKAKTHCPHGHEYTYDNTNLYKGRRRCRICMCIRERARQKRLRELLNRNGCDLLRFK